MKVRKTKESKRKPIVDSRLVGNWKSDKRKTFQHYTAPYRGTRKGKKLLRSLFGKLNVRWARKYVYTELEGFKTKEKYEILAQDEHTVAVRLTESNHLEHIHFEDGKYWIWAGFTREYFARIPSSQP
ncbi:MAG: hypothetical protein K8R36_00825 [Planctomycetales bacterium]|nr:hypothetical protein [Planctomycetales bacterium]